MEKIIEINPAYDKRNPKPSKNYGVHGVDIRFILIGDKGATQFVLYTNWYLPHVTQEFLNKPILSKQDIKLFFLPMPADLGYHSKVPFYDDHLHTEDCPYTGGDCYYDGSTMAADRIYNVLLEEGADGVWKELEKHYKEIFETDENSA